MFFENAHLGKNQFWRYLLTITIFIICFIIISLIFIILFDSLSIVYPTPKNTELFIELAPMATGFFLLLFLINKIHKKPILSVLTSRKSFDFKRFFFTIFICLFITIIATYLFVSEQDYQFKFNFAPFAKLFLISIFLLPLQCAVEEVLFRGYLLQAFGKLFKNKLAALILITILFAALHLGNPEFNHDFYRVMAEYLIISIFFGLIVVLDNGLEIAIGAHTANNLFVSLIINPSDGAFQTDAIFTTNMDAILQSSILITILPTILIFAILYHKYDWHFSMLFEPIKPPIQAERV